MSVAGRKEPSSNALLAKTSSCWNRWVALFPKGEGPIGLYESPRAARVLHDAVHRHVLGRHDATHGLLLPFVLLSLFSLFSLLSFLSLFLFPWSAHATRRAPTGVSRMCRGLPTPAPPSGVSVRGDMGVCL